MTPNELITTWEAEAVTLRARYADERCAALCIAHVDELRKALKNTAEEALDIDLAADESGYSLSSMRRMLREGTVPNAGTDNDPKVLRKHLPRKPGFGVEPPAPPESSPVAGTIGHRVGSRGQIARAVVSGGGK